MRRWLAALALLAATGAAPPEGGPQVVRLRVPSARVGDWFPPGTELKGLSPGDLDALERAARAGAARRGGVGEPRLLKATHSARWEGGRLVGRSVLVIGPAAHPAALILDPWSPAVEPPAKGPDAVRSDAAGRTTLRVEPADPGETVTATVAWQLTARPGSGGRRFDLALPAAGAAVLEIDLPENLEPEGPGGMRVGPLPGGAPGRAAWSFAGFTGASDLILYDPGAADDAPGWPRVVVEGPTRVELAEASADWSVEWAVTGPRWSARPLVLDLDPGLVVLGVDGPAVEEFHARPSPSEGGGTRLEVRLRGGAGPTTVTVRARGVVPAEGTWVVPSARPVGAVWAGGRTTVWLDPSRTLAGLRPRAGRRAPPPPEAAGEEGRLDFEAERPGPVAELVFRAPGADVSAEVRGQLVVGAGSPRLSARVSWRVDRGRPPGLVVDLPRSWFADRVEIEGQADPPAWHPEVRPDGTTRLHITPPTDDRPGGAVSALVWATAAVAGGRGPLALPRVRAAGVRGGDEVWVARVEAGVSLVPLRARGLAWIDPAALPIGPPPVARPDEPADPSSLALAWRWTADDAEARVERGRAGSAARGEVGMAAAVGPDRLDVRARVVVVPGDEPVRSVVLGLSEPVSDPTSWRVRDESTGVELARAPGGPLAGPGRGPWWRFELPQPQHGRLALEVRHAGPWPGRGNVPLVLLPEPLRARGTLLVLAGRDVPTTAVATSARALDPAIVAGSFADGGGPSPEPPADAPAPRRAHAFAYDGPEAVIALTAGPFAPVDDGGVIREAALTSLVSPGGETGWRRLTLHVVPGRAAELGVVLPPGAALEQAIRDGQPVAPSVNPGRLSIPLGATASGGGRPPVVVTLDYRLPPPGGADRGVVRPERPGLSMPCLALRWEVVAPAGWAVADWGGALIPADPGVARHGFWDRLAGPGPSWLRARLRGAASRRAREAEAAALDDLGARLAGNEVDEMSLADWLTRLDAGTTPLVVDRGALARAGFGPRSRVAPPHGERARALSAQAAFRAAGLALVPVGRVALVTAPSEVPVPGAGPARARWEGALAAALSWGSDPADRFQSVPRWREAAPPRSPVAAESGPALPAEPGRAVWRFAASGWPESGAEVRLVDRRAQAAWGWAVGLAVVTLGLAARRVPRPGRAAGAAALFAAGAWGRVFAPPSFAGAALGLTAGPVALAILWAGRALPVLPRPRRREPRTSTGGRRAAPTGSGLVAPLIVAVVVVTPWALTLAQTREGPPPDSPVVALLPYDGPPDPSRAPDRAVLRLADYRRLRSLADGAPTGPRTETAASAATHRVTRRGDAVEVETTLTLVTTGHGPARWAFPVGDARAITAECDRASVPVRVEPGGKTATVEVRRANGDGDREATLRVVLRRSIVPREADGAAAIYLPVNPVATARVVVEGGPGSPRVEFPGARGPVEARDGVTSGRLGPVGRLEVRWPGPGRSEPPAPSGVVEGLELWDAVPAGDRVRARLTYRNPGGTAVVRVGLEPGMVVRDIGLPGPAALTLEGTAERPEWVARFDPPLPDGATVSLDFWRPRGDGLASGTGARAMPRVEPRGAERVSAAVAFRRPSAWSGRLAPGAEAEALGEEAFVRVWGALPPEALTLSGAVRLGAAQGGPTPAVTVNVGPPPERWRVQPSAQVSLAEGRVDVAFDAELAETGGLVDEAEVTIPEGFRVERVAADGLTDWTRAPGGAIRLRFDGPPARLRRARIRGWMLVPGDPLAPSRTGHEIESPWALWPGQDEQPGTLSVTGPAGFRLIPGRGDDPAPPALTPAPVPADPASGQTRGTWRIDPGRPPGRLRWDDAPPRVAVFVQSQVTLHPDTAEWVAVLRYEVTGGPLDEINLRLPAAWAKGAEIRLDGVRHRRSAGASGENVDWRVRPDRPVWGVQRVVVRSSVPFPAGASRPFPDLRPRGFGEADTYLRLVNATRQPIVPEGGEGVREVASQALVADEELAAAAPRAAPVKTYHVDRGQWTLRVAKAGPAGPAGDPSAPRVARAEHVVTIAPDGSARGVARYYVGATAGGFLAVRLGAGASPVWAAVETTPAPPLRAGPGRWLVPLAESSRLSRVTLVWRADPPAGPHPPFAAKPVALPAVEAEGRVPAAVRVYAPEGSAVATASDRLATAGPARLDLDAAGWLASEVAAWLPGLDRSSRRDAEDLVAGLVGVELLLRQAARAAPGDPGVAGAAGPVRERLASALGELALDELAVSARAAVGLDPDETAPTTAPTIDTPTPVSLRALGRPHGFLGSQPPPGDPPPLTWTPGVPRDDASDGGWLLLAALAVLGPPFTGLAARRGRALRAVALAALAAALGGLLAWLGPAGFAAGLGLAAAGKAVRD